MSAMQFSTTSIPTPKFKQSLVQSRRAFPALVNSRNGVSQVTSFDGKLKSVAINTPCLDYRDQKLEGHRVDGQCTNMLLVATPQHNAQSYGIQNTGTSVTTPHGSTVTILRENANTGGYTDHVIDLINAVTNLTNIRTFSYSVKVPSGRTDRIVSIYPVIDGVRHYCNATFGAGGKVIAATGSGTHLEPVGDFYELGDGWWRVIFYFKNPVTIASSRVCILHATLGGGWDGNNVDTSYQFIVGDMQYTRDFHGLRFARTTGSTVSLLADNSYIDVGASTKHTFLVEAKTCGNILLAASGALLSSSNASLHLAAMIAGGGALDKRGGFARYSGNASIENNQISHVVDRNTIYRQALSYDQETGTIIIAHNGQVQTVQTKIPGLVFDRLGLGNSGSAGHYLGGYICKMAYWDEALTTKELQKITSF